MTSRRDNGMHLLLGAFAAVALIAASGLILMGGSSAVVRRRQAVCKGRCSAAVPLADRSCRSAVLVCTCTQQCN